MTVCIAGKCVDGDEPRIVLCSDARLETGEAGGDISFKMDLLAKGFVSLLAGNLQRAIELNAFLRKSFYGKQIADPTSFLELLREAMYAYRTVLVEELIQTTLSMSYETFLDVGKASLPDDVLLNVMNQIAATDTECELLLAGFIGREPVILTVDSDCKVKLDDPFTSIGSGSTVANVALFRRKYTEFMDIHEAIYCVYEAKKLSEITPGVGPRTDMLVLGKDGDHTMSWPVPRKTAEPLLNKMYADFGPKPFVPPDDSMKWMLVSRGPKSSGSEDPQSPKDDQSHPPPLQASPGGSGES